MSGYRRGTNYIQGFSNIGDFAGTFGIGVKNRLEIFGSFLFDTRIDRDIRPLFINNLETGGFVDRYPRMTTTWSGDNVGDFHIGAKVNFMSEADQRARRPRGACALQGADRRRCGRCVDREGRLRLRLHCQQGDCGAVVESVGVRGL